MRILQLITLLFISMISITAFGQMIPSEPSIGPMLTELFTNWSGLGSVGIAMIIIVIVVQVLKWSVLDRLLDKQSKYVKIGKKILVYVLGMVYSVLFLVKSGTPAFQAIIGLLTGGGAIVLYNIAKPLWEKE